MTDIISWSPVDASNNAAPPAGWPENMQPSAVNDCARAMMGAIRRYYDTLLSGSFVLPYLPITGGSVSGNITATGQINAAGVTAGSGTIGSLTLTGSGSAVLNVPNGGINVAGAVNAGSSTFSTIQITSASGAALLLSSGGITTAGPITAQGTGFAITLPAGAINVAGYSSFSNGFASGGPINTAGQLNVSAGGNAAINVPAGGITVAGASSFPSIYGGPGAAGTLRTWNTANTVCFRWDGYNLSFRVDETVEYKLPYITPGSFNGFTLGTSGSPTGYSLVAYSGSTPFELFVDAVSDARLKENVRDTRVDALGAILATPVRAFDWSEAGRQYMPYIDPHAPIGLVAQEVQETMPWVVGVSNFKESDDVPVQDMHRVLHDRLTAYLVRAVQQLSARIDSLTTGENHV